VPILLSLIFTAMFHLSPLIQFHIV
jgi:hypothetical protein